MTIKHEQENFATKLNYDQTARNLLAFGFFGALGMGAGYFDRSETTPPLLQGHIRDSLSVLVYGPMQRLTSNKNFGTIDSAIRGFGIASAIEGTQYLKLLPGTYDPYDFLAYGVSAIAWISFDSAAKTLYNSGFTKPMYRRLHIKDQRSVIE